jgi:hypothetical protein
VLQLRRSFVTVRPYWCRDAGRRRVTQPAPGASLEADVLRISVQAAPRPNPRRPRLSLPCSIDPSRTPAPGVRARSAVPAARDR